MTSTQSTAIDLVALRAWHWKASQDIERDPAIRRWHKTQSQIITLKIAKHTKRTLDPLTIGGIEILVSSGRDGIHDCASKIFAGDWEQFCEAAREQIAKMRLHPTK